MSRVPNKLFEAAATEAVQNLIGKLVRTKTDPLSKVLGLELQTEEENPIGMIVKIENPTRKKGWIFYVLLDEKIQDFSYSNFSDFYDQWTVLK